MKHATIVFACLLPLAACNRDGEVKAKDASIADVAAKVRKSGAGQNFVRPGLWESKVTIEQLEIPGMPPEAASQMKAMMAEKRPEGFKTCLTPEDVKQPKEDFFAGMNKQCRYDHFNMGGGKIDAVMRCGDKTASQVMRMSGTYSPDSYQMQMSSKVEAAAQGAQGAMQMRMRVESRRIGDCTGKEGRIAP